MLQLNIVTGHRLLAIPIFREPAQIRCTLNKTRSILEVENLLLIARRGNGRIMILVLGGN